MKEKLLTGWTFMRVLYLVLGSMIIIQSLQQKEWAGIIFGGYFAAMGLFALGCAGGACFPGSRSCRYEPGSLPEEKEEKPGILPEIKKET